MNRLIYLLLIAVCLHSTDIYAKGERTLKNQKSTFTTVNTTKKVVAGFAGSVLVGGGAGYLAYELVGKNAGHGPGALLAVAVGVPALVFGAVYGASGGVYLVGNANSENGSFQKARNSAWWGLLLSCGATAIVVNTMDQNTDTYKVAMLLSFLPIGVTATNGYNKSVKQKKMMSLRPVIDRTGKKISAGIQLTYSFMP